MKKAGQATKSENKNYDVQNDSSPDAQHFLNLLQSMSLSDAKTALDTMNQSGEFSMIKVINAEQLNEMPNNIQQGNQYSYATEACFAQHQQHTNLGGADQQYTDQS